MWKARWWSIFKRRKKSFDQLEPESRKLAIAIIRRVLSQSGTFQDPLVRAMGLSPESAEEAVLELMEKGLVKILCVEDESGKQSYGLGLYDFKSRSYRPVGGWPK